MNKTEEKIKELKKWIKKLGMTQKYFARQFFIDDYIYDNDNEEDIEIFYEKFRGHLKRNTTSVETIDIYLNYLYNMEEFKKKCYIKPTYIKDEIFGKEFDERMKKISKNITEILEKKED